MRWDKESWFKSALCWRRVRQYNAHFPGFPIGTLHVRSDLTAREFYDRVTEAIRTHKRIRGNTYTFYWHYPPGVEVH